VPSLPISDYRSLLIGKMEKTYTFPSLLGSIGAYRSSPGPIRVILEICLTFFTKSGLGPHLRVKGRSVKLAACIDVFRF